MNEPFLIIGSAACAIGSILHFQFRGRYPVDRLNDQEKSIMDRRRLLANMAIVMLGGFLIAASFVQSNLWKVTFLSGSLILMVVVCVLGTRDAVNIFYLRKKYTDNHKLNELREEIRTIVAINKAAKETKEQGEP